MFKRLFIILFVCFYSFSIHAQENEIEIIELDDIIISATRNPASLENISSSSHIISPVQIQSSASTNLGQILETSNILNISDYGPGGFAMASIRGSSSEQVLVLLDGQRINDSRSGVVDLNNIPLNSISRIEIVKGGNSAMYGADAVGGVINIITKNPVSSKVKAWSSMGSYSAYNWGIETSRTSDNVSGLVTLSQSKAEADFPFRDKFDREMIRENAQSKIRNIFGKINWNISSKADLRASGGHSYSVKGDPGPVGLYTPDASKKDKVNEIKTHFNYQPLSFFHFNVNIQGRKTSLRYINPKMPYPTDDTHKNRVMDSEFQFRFLPETKIPIIAGVYLRDEVMDSTALGIKKRETYSFYAQQEIKREFGQNPFRLKGISIFPAIRWDHYSDFNAGLSPKIGFLTSFGDENSLAFRGNIGISYRAPNMNDLYWPSDAFAVGNPDLNPETSLNADAGFYINVSQQSFLSYISDFRLGSTLFRNEFKDRIQWTPGPDGKWSPQNLSEATSTGLESELQIEIPFKQIPDFIFLGLNHNLLFAKDMLDRQLIYRPTNSLGYRLRIQNRDIWWQVGGSYQSRRYTTLQNTKWLEPYIKHDMQIGLERRVWKNLKAGFVFEIKNLFDTEYQMVADYPLPGREWRVKTSFGLEGD
ncbi:TonB-dependent receptor [Candidatus Poribacteria bacterium]|nr:TonB-dependent receptor [Candidatus Poribacteria bacterium]